jgi:hypothetical protein
MRLYNWILSTIIGRQSVGVREAFLAIMSVQLDRRHGQISQRSLQQACAKANTISVGMSSHLLYLRFSEKRAWPVEGLKGHPELFEVGLNRT